jgi:hypothetical protein
MGLMAKSVKLQNALSAEVKRMRVKVGVIQYC